MTAPETHCPPTAPTPGRLRQARVWPYATRPADAPTPADAAPAPGFPAHDFLCLLPGPAPATEPPATKPKPLAPERETLTAVEALALAPLNRTFWFDL